MSHQRSAILPVCTAAVLFATACGGGGSDAEDAVTNAIGSYRVAAIDRDENGLKEFFNPNYRDSCQAGVLTQILASIDTETTLDVSEVTTVEEGDTERVTALASGPWGDDGVFVARFGDEVEDEASPSADPFLADPFLFECLKAGSSQALEKWEVLHPRILEITRQLEVLDIALAEETRSLNQNTDLVLEVFRTRLDEVSQNEDYVGRLDLLAQGSALLGNLEDTESALPALESLIPSTLEECRADLHPYKVCAELGLAPPLTFTYAGPYSFSGSTKTRTDDFCLTADKVTIEYSAQGIGLPDYIYVLMVWLYDDAGNYVDVSGSLKGSGEVSFGTKGEGCYYLVLDPYEASWAVSVRQ